MRAGDYFSISCGDPDSEGDLGWRKRPRPFAHPEQRLWCELLLQALTDANCRADSDQRTKARRWLSGAHADFYRAMDFCDISVGWWQRKCLPELHRRWYPPTLVISVTIGQALPPVVPAEPVVMIEAWLRPVTAARVLGVTDAALRRRIINGEFRSRREGAARFVLVEYPAPAEPRLTGSG